MTHFVRIQAIRHSFLKVGNLFAAAPYQFRLIRFLGSVTHWHTVRAERWVIIHGTLMRSNRKALYAVENDGDETVLAVFIDADFTATVRRAERFRAMYERHIGANSVRLIEVELAPTAWREHCSGQ